MANIIRPAYFEICPNCGLHGHLTFSDKSTSREIRSRLEALKLLSQALGEGKVTLPEADLLADEIIESSLPHGLSALIIEVKGDIPTKSLN